MCASSKNVFSRLQEAANDHRCAHGGFGIAGRGSPCSFLSDGRTSRDSALAGVEPRMSEVAAVAVGRTVEDVSLTVHNSARYRVSSDLQRSKPGSRGEQCLGNRRHPAGGACCLRRGSMQRTCAPHWSRGNPSFGRRDGPVPVRAQGGDVRLGRHRAVPHP